MEVSISLSKMKWVCVHSMAWLFSVEKCLVLGGCILHGISSNTLATYCEESTHWKRPWCWERLKAGGEGDNRGWDDRMASPTRSRSWNKLQEIVKDREAHVLHAVHGVAKSRTWLSHWTTTTTQKWKPRKVKLIVRGYQRVLLPMVTKTTD